MISTQPKAERSLLVGIQIKGRSSLWTVEDSLEELSELARSAGAHVVESMVQRLERPTNVYLGKGNQNLKLVEDRWRTLPSAFLHYRLFW